MPQSGLPDVTVPRRLRAPAPGWTTTADVIVVGSGIAGLTTALRLRRRVDRVLLVTKTVLDEGSTAWAQGGIAAVMSPEDSPAEHIHDTLVAGVGLCDVDAVETLVREGTDAVVGPHRARGRVRPWRHGGLSLTREGGHHRDRILHAGGDATGREISRALIAALDRVRDDPGIEVIEHALVVDLLTDADQRVCGVTLHVIGEGQVDGVGAAHARAVVLATGGLGQIYASTTNPSVATGDGMAAALRAGAVLADLEFVQFHPTVLWLGEGSRGQQPLISEAVRGEGAFLVDEAGERFMQGQHPLADLAPRDVVARAIIARMRETGTDHVYLDCRHLGRRVPRAALPVDRLPLSRARVRPRDAAAAGRTGAALRQRRGAHRPARTVLARGSLRVRRDLVHRRARRQPAREQLAPRGARLRAPHRRRPHDPARLRVSSPRRRPSHPAVSGADPRQAPTRRAARHDRGVRDGPLGRVARRGAGDPRRARGSRGHRRRRQAGRTQELGGDQPAPPRTGPDVCAQPCGTRPVAVTCARTSRRATTSTSCTTCTCSAPTPGSSRPCRAVPRSNLDGLDLDHQARARLRRGLLTDERTPVTTDGLSGFPHEWATALVDVALRRGPRSRRRRRDDPGHDPG